MSTDKTANTRSHEAPEWLNTGVLPAGVTDDIVGWARLDGSLTSLGQAVTSLAEALDLESVLTALDRVLAGDQRSTMQIIDELRAATR